MAGKSSHTRRIVTDWLFISPQLVIYVVLTLVPFFVAIPILFTDRSTFIDPDVNYVGFDNFTRLFTDEKVAQDYWPVFWRTMRFAGVNYLMAFAFGLPLALLMYEVGFNGGFFTIIYLPWMISGLALGYMTTMLFSRTTGSANLLLMEFGVLDQAIDIKQPGNTGWILPLLVGWRSAGFYMAILLAGLLSIPRETVEAATVDGARYLQRLLYVYIPQMWPSIIIVSIFSIAQSFNLFDELVGLGGLEQNPEATFLSVLFVNYGFRLDRLALGLTLSLQTFLPLIVIGIFLQRLQRRLQVEA